MRVYKGDAASALVLWGVDGGAESVLWGVDGRAAISLVEGKGGGGTYMRGWVD